MSAYSKTFGCQTREIDLRLPQDRLRTESQFNSSLQYSHHSGMLPIFIRWSERSSTVKQVRLFR